MPCPFCAVVDGDAPGVVLDERSESLVVVPRTPETPGHVLVVTRDHYRSLFDVPEEVLSDVTEHARDVSHRLQTAGYDGVNLLHASGEAAQQSVPHFHIHLAPRRDVDGYDLWPASNQWDGTNQHGVYDELHAVLGDER
ncbi:HIT family protein [Haloprofundus sp. MHR1]|uniref:HIT family protein n=1 Tax=Haloprofundus sp. MHR1 TaxID=2572921 RepID=UPI0010BE342D|nr:HIT family protein [Haloprofundus sp. MHR1]QCJ48383.1 HIT family protein [Haloprofundus sp. MHR1]